MFSKVNTFSNGLFMILMVVNIFFSIYNGYYYFMYNFSFVLPFYLIVVISSFFLRKNTIVFGKQLGVFALYFLFMWVVYSVFDI